MAKKSTSASSSKLTRSETVTVRLDPKLRYLAELAARKQRRTVSSYIEWAVEQSLKLVLLYQGSGYNNDVDINLEEEVNILWDVDESERFVRLAIKYPELLTHQEQEIWKLLSDSTLLTPARSRSSDRTLQWDWAILEDYVFPTIRKYWPHLMMAYIEGKSKANEWVENTQKEISSNKVYIDLNKPDAPISYDDIDVPF